MVIDIVVNEDIDGNVVEIDIDDVGDVFCVIDINMWIMLIRLLKMMLLE